MHQLLLKDIHSWFVLMTGYTVCDCTSHMHNDLLQNLKPMQNTVTLP